MKTILTKFLLLAAGMLLASNISQAACCNAGFNYQQSAGTNHYSFTMDDTIGTNTQYVQWDFGDGQYSNQINPSHVYSSSGIHNVNLSVYNITIRNSDTIRNTCTETRKIYIPHDSLHCLASYQFSANNLSLAFTNLSHSLHSDSINYIWNFGDGHFSHQANPVHIFNNPGLYNVCLYARQTDSLATDSCFYCQSIYVQNNDTNVSNCQADFSYSVTGNNVTLSASHYAANSVWYNNVHGTLFYGNDSTIAFSDSGTYQICHRTADSLNAYDTCTVCKYVTIISHLRDSTTSHCNADFSAAVTGNNVTLSASHYAANSVWYDNVHGILFYGNNSTIAFSDTGTYQICHRTADSLNVHDTCTVCKYVTIVSPHDSVTTCDADFAYVISGNTVSVMASYNNVPGKLYWWTFDSDYFVRDSLNVSYTFATDGVKNICHRGYTFINGIYTDSCVTCKQLSIGGDSLVSRPNPANEHLTFSVSKDLIKSIHIHDMHGNLVKQINDLSAKEYEVNVADLAKGMYNATIRLHDNRAYKSTVIVE